LSHGLVVIGVIVASELQSTALLSLVTTKKQQYYRENERSAS
jgi:hypothetical protein